MDFIGVFCDILNHWEYNLILVKALLWLQCYLKNETMRRKVFWEKYHSVIKIEMQKPKKGGENLLVAGDL